MIWIIVIAYLLFLFFAYYLAQAAGRPCPHLGETND